jgi:EAL domain-containing protein (putative c-di-GMP-specific phosphodiesterase class I)
MVLSGQLRAAIENGDIQAYFQPLVRARDMRVVGFETLGRWFHPEFGPIPPPEFVKIAEENGLITPLTDVIMRKAIEAARQWPNDVRVSVNVSPVQINSDLVDQVRGIIKQSGLDPHRLELEVTEDVLIKDFDQTASMFSRLRALGIQVAMDDFGAGFTSMGNLRRLNFDRLKIDRIFTMDLPNHRRSSAIVRSMFVLARELDLEVTVEGVETYEQYAFLREQGNAELQGYLFSPAETRLRLHRSGLASVRNADATQDGVRCREHWRNPDQHASGQARVLTYRQALDRSLRRRGMVGRWEKQLWWREPAAPPRNA